MRAQALSPPSHAVLPVRVPRVCEFCPGSRSSAMASELPFCGCPLRVIGRECVARVV